MIECSGLKLQINKFHCADKISYLKKAIVGWDHPLDENAWQESIENSRQKLAYFCLTVIIIDLHCAVRQKFLIMVPDEISDLFGKFANGLDRIFDMLLFNKEAFEPDINVLDECDHVVENLAADRKSVV